MAVRCLSCSRAAVSIPSMEPLSLISISTRSGDRASAALSASRPVATRGRTSYPKPVKMRRMSCATRISSSTTMMLLFISCSPVRATPCTSRGRPASLRDFDAVPASSFGSVEGRVGPLQPRLIRLRMGFATKLRDADAERDGANEDTSIRYGGDGPDRRPHTLHALPRAGERLLRQKRKELVASVSKEAIAASKLDSHGAGYRSNCVVARKVPESVVVALERVDIAKGEAISVAVAEHPIGDAFELGFKVQSIARLRQRIDARGSQVAVARTFALLGPRREHRVQLGELLRLCDHLRFGGV